MLLGMKNSAEMQENCLGSGGVPQEDS